MSHDDTMRNLNAKLAKWERIRSDAEGLEVTDRRKVERRRVRPMAKIIYAINTVACFVAAWLIFAAMIYTPDELYRNSWLALIFGAR